MRDKQKDRIVNRSYFPHREQNGKQGETQNLADANAAAAAQSAAQGGTA